jgi:two-component system, cell cycle sensor histidine kinase and response regulator CckA
MIQQAKPCILIVEDDPGMTVLEQRHLERAGYGAVTAPTADAALRRLTENHIDLILLDYQLPGDVDGLDFYQQVKAAGFDVPVILITAFSSEAVVIRALRSGMRDYVAESVEFLDYLPDAVERVLRQIRLEHQLSESETRLASIIDSAMDAIVTTDAGNRITLFNPSAEKMFRCSGALALGEPIVRFLSASASEGPPFPRPGGEGGRSDQRTECKGKRADGEQFPVEASISYAQVGGQSMCTLIARDVTERKRMEKALRESEMRFKTFMDNSPSIAFVKEDGGRYIYVSNQVERFLGRKAADLVGRTDLELWPPETAKQLRDHDLAVLTSGRSTEVEEVLPRADGAPSHWLALRFPFKDGSGAKLLGGVALEISERKRLEEQFLQSQKIEAVGRLAGGVAHDFNNLLTVISGFCDILLRTHSLADSSRALVEEIYKAGDRAALLTRQLLAFSRKQMLLPQVISFNAIVADMDKMLRRVIGEDVELAAILGPNLRTVLADRGQIGQVILNLAVNARDAMPRGGKLTIETANVHLDESYVAAHPELRVGPYAMLAVSDTGAGMSEEVKTHIFEPFFTTKDVGKGSGLGLATVFGIVKQSGGHIDVYSEAGCGTTFKIYLPPVAAAGREAVAEPVFTDVPRGSETILLVEDADPVRVLTREALQQCGYTVLEASQGREGLELAMQFGGKIDLLVTDVVMPQLGGPELARMLCSVRPETRVMYMSGYTDDAVFRHGLLDGETAFIQKPFAMDALARKVREVLDHQDASAVP